MPRKPKPKSIDLSKLLWVDVREAKPNPLFTEDQRQMIRFLVYNRAVPCAACGKKKKGLWTMLCTFKAGDMNATAFVMQDYPTSFAPLTPVCCDHPLHPDMEAARG